MNIEKNVFVAIDYTLTLESGDKVDASPEGQPLGFITGSGQIIPGLENRLMGMGVGDSSRIEVEPEDAYGPVREELIQDIPLSQFPPDMEIEKGMTFQADGPHGPILMTVKEKPSGGMVTMDLNHPLAGKRLIFDVNVVEVRPPSAQELARLGGASACGCGSDDGGSCGPGCSCG